MRKSYIINNALRAFFIASVLSSVITQLNALVDGIIVSHVVNEDAISAVNMCTPVFAIIMLIASMIYSGAGILIANALGNQKYDAVNRIYSVSIVSVIVINVVIGIVCCCCVDQIANLLTSEQRLLPLLKSYMPISFIGNLFVAFQLSMSQFVKVAGQPNLVTKCMTIQSLGNIVLDLLFVVVFGWGMQGAAAASALSALLSTVVFIPYLRSADRSFSFVKVPASKFFKTLAEDARRGMPVAIGTVVMSAMILSLNALVLKTKGADGMFILSVCMQVLMLSMLLLSGAGSAITGIGGILLGEYDYENMRRLLTVIFKAILAVMVCFTIFVQLFPQFLARLFGAEGDLLQATLTPLRQFSLIMIPIGLIIPLSNLFVALNRNTLATFMNIAMLAGLVPLVFIATIFFPDYLWLSMGISMWIVLLVSMVCIFIVSRRNKGLHWFFLAPQVDTDNTISVSVKYDRKDAIEKVEMITKILKSRNLSCYDNVKHCMEEILMNEADKGIAADRHDVFDVFSSLIDGKFTIILKSIGAPFNPLTVISEEESETSSSDLMIRMSIIKGFSSDANYKYMNGVNCLYLNISTNEIK